MEIGQVPIIILTTPNRKEQVKNLAKELDLSMRKIIERAIDNYLINFKQEDKRRERR